MVVPDPGRLGMEAEVAGTEPGVRGQGGYPTERNAQEPRDEDEEDERVVMRQR